jgi:hypothetical protein
MSGQLRRAAVVGAACALIVSTQAAAASGLPSSLAGASSQELAVLITGNGFGTVADNSPPPNSPPPQTCSTTSTQPCTFQYSDVPQTATFTATPAPGSFFVGWGDIGSACGSTPTCTLTFFPQSVLLAVFHRNPAPPVAPDLHHHRHHHGCTNDPGIDASNDPECPRPHVRRAAVLAPA